MVNALKTRADIQGFLEAVVQWAAGQADIQAAALVGSYARDAAREDSDIDLVLLMDDPARYLHDTAWVGRFGAMERQQVEDYGKVTSLRLWYRNGPEVEFGLTTPDWAAPPLDEGTRRVITDGMVVLQEKLPLLSPLSK